MTSSPPSAPSRGLVARGIARGYGARLALDDVNLTIVPGTLACLIGPNGAGKSTLLRILAGLQLPDAGEVHLDGVRVNAPDAPDEVLLHARRTIALTPQELDLMEHLTPQETLRTVCRLRGVPDDESGPSIERWMTELLLDETRLRMVRELSGGQKRKVAIAATLITNPRVALLDESFTGLDPESVAAVERALRSFCDEGGIVLLSSHVLDLVLRLADQLILLTPRRVHEVLDRPTLHNLIPSTYPHLGAYYLDRVEQARQASDRDAS